MLGWLVNYFLDCGDDEEEDQPSQENYGSMADIAMVGTRDVWCLVNLSNFFDEKAVKGVRESMRLQMTSGSLRQIQCGDDDRDDGDDEGI